MTNAATTTDSIRNAPTGNNGAALLTGMEAWWSAAGECQREMADFMSLRTEKDSKFFREALACKNPTDALSVQSHWMEETLRDYSAEMTKMLAIYTKH
jgi:hypothetical protein